MGFSVKSEEFNLALNNLKKITSENLKFLQLIYVSIYRNIILEKV